MGRIVIVGAGQAGFSLAAKLRKLGHTGDLSLIGDETFPPYQRPPLSKGYLLGDMALERLFFRPEQFYADESVNLLLGHPVTGLDRTARTVRLDDTEIPYDQLAFTTGSSARSLPDAMGGALDGVHVVRTLADVDQMAPEITAGNRALIVGGGYIGLEAAAAASKLGMSVTLIEMADRILQRVASPQTSTYFRNLHGSHGVNILEGTGLDALLGTEKLQGARFSDGTEKEFDIAIVGIGILPNTELAQAAGLTIENGISTDEFGATSDSAIWAAGDCASFPYRGGRIRLESVQNAIDQAEAVAGNMMGPKKRYVPKPWFWSDQYDVKLQIAGLNTGYEKIVIRYETAGGPRSHWYFAGDKLLSVDSMNDPRAYMVGKRLIEAGKSADPNVVGDTAFDLKQLLKP